MAHNTVERPKGDRSFFGHPIGLMTLFTTEFWERFSYYGMRAILLFFLTDQVTNQGLGLDEATGKALVATYSSSVFLLSVIGGWLADRLWGPRRATLYGGIVIALGHICLAVPVASTAYLGIMCVALGTGVLKPNISTMVGELYDEDDPRRDAGFSIFYMGINLGSFVAPLVVGWVRSIWGYHAGFSVVAIGMAVALIFFIANRNHLDRRADRVPNPITPEQRARVTAGIIVLVVVLVLFWALVKLITKDDSLNTSITTLNLLAFIVPICYFIMMFRSPQVSAPERTRLTAYIPIFLAAAMFWMLFEQAASSMSDFAKEKTDLTIFGRAFSPEFYQSVNPLFIILFAGAFAAMWTRLKGRPSTPTKFAIGLALATIAFVFLGTMARVFQDGLAPWWVLFVTYVVETIGELCLSPVGLAATTLLAPRAFKSQAMALWFMASAFGQAITAQIFKQLPELTQSQEFLLFAAIAGVFTIIFIGLIPWINRHIRAGLVEVQH